MANTQLHEGRINWTSDLVASTASTVFPSGASAGVALTNGGDAHTGRVAVKVHLTCTTAPLSATVSVYGLDDGGQWQYINTLNAGSSITANTSKWSTNASTAVLTEIIAYPIGTPVYCGNYARFATRCIVSSPSFQIVSTWIGETAG